MKKMRVEVGGRQPGQALGQLEGGGVRVAPDRKVRELLGLTGRRLCQLFAPVARGHHEQAGQPVEVPPALVVPHVAALAARDDRQLLGFVRSEAGEVHPEMLASQCLEVPARCLPGAAILRSASVLAQCAPHV